MYNAASLQLRQVRDLGQTISATFQFLRHNWKPIYSTLAVVCLPISILVALGNSYAVAETFANFPTGEGGFEESMASMNRMQRMQNVQYLMSALGLLVYLIGMIIVSEYMAAYAKNEHVGITVRELARRTFSHFGTYLGIGFLNGLMIFFGLLLCLIPGFYLWPNLVLGIPCHAVERSDVTTCISRSFQLTKNNWWESFGIGVLLVIIVGLISLALQLPFLLYSGFSIFSGFESIGDDPLEMIRAFSAQTPMLIIVGSLVGLITYPIHSVAAGIRYFSLVESREQAGLGEQVKQFDQL